MHHFICALEKRIDDPTKTEFVKLWDMIECPERTRQKNVDAPLTVNPSKIEF